MFHFRRAWIGVIVAGLAVAVAGCPAKSEQKRPADDEPRARLPDRRNGRRSSRQRGLAGRRAGGRATACRKRLAKRRTNQPCPRRSRNRLCRLPRSPRSPSATRSRSVAWSTSATRCRRPSCPILPESLLP